MGIQELLDSSQTPNIGHLARKYMLYGGYRFNGVAWEYAVNRLIRSLKTTQVVIQTQDNYEHDLLDSDDYYQFEGGINAALRHCRSKVCAYHVDTSCALEGRIKIRSLKHELARIVSCKLLNKRWVLSMLTNGYRGASEILANLCYFCNFAVTTAQTADAQFKGIYSLLLENKEVADALIKANAPAYRAIKRKLFEAVCTGI